MQFPGSDGSSRVTYGIPDAGSNAISSRHQSDNTIARSGVDELISDRVAVGRYRPTAPTDPYVRTLPHTVPLIMDSLRV